jgi:ketosteroid isomerase-like protein
MSAADVEALAAVYAKWAQGDFATPEIFHEGIQVIWAEEVPGLNETRGLPALVAAVRTWLEAWEHASIEAESIHDGGNCVLVLYNSHVRHRESAQQLDWRGAHVWTMRDGKASKLKAFIDVQEAAAEAGIALP